MRLGERVVGDEAGPLMFGDINSDALCGSMISVFPVDERQDGPRIPEHGSSHWARILCLSRAPGRVPLLPAPTSRKSGLSRVKGGIRSLRMRLVRATSPRAGMSRRPPFRTFSTAPLRIIRQIVETETPIASLASATPRSGICLDFRMCEIYQTTIISSIVSISLERPVDL